MNKLIGYVVVFLFPVVFSGCFSARSIVKTSSEKFPIPDNGIHKDILFYDNMPYPSVFFIYARQKEKALHLPELLNGFDEFAFRAWISSPTGEGVQEGELIEIRQTKGEWSGTYYTMDLKFVPSKNEEQVLSHKSYDIKPTDITWNQLLGYLVNDGIFELQSLDESEAYQALPASEKGYVKGSSVISFEVATAKLYRFFQYHSLSKYPQIEEVRRVDDIMKLLKYEFNIAEVIYNDSIR
jgi:hypothetical protein